MGLYINPGNQAFAEISGSDYVDKTGLIDLMNQRIGTGDKLVCISRPRRFGKTYAAKMLAAYYDCSCNSEKLFRDRKIAGTRDYEKFMNQFNVICFDVTTFISNAKSMNRSLREVPEMIKKAIWKDLIESGFHPQEGDELNDFLLRCVEESNGKRFVFIIDEWDAMIREAKNDLTAQEAYLNLLRAWFKSISFTPKVVAAAYMTGIIPIKKDSSQSAISDFREYSMLDPDVFAEYFGFTEEEVKSICTDHNLDFDDMRRWYDGYILGNISSIYNPFSVMEAARKHRFRSYWKRTSASEALMTYIDMDQESLQDDIAALISGQSIEVDTDSFQNDFETFASKDDVLTLLIHLGYLTYDEDESNGLAAIPNEEVRIEFDKILRKAKHKKLIELVRKSDRLLTDTLAGDSEAVARAIQEVHETSFAPAFYNDEQALRYTVKMAYISCVDQYARVEELPSGHGIADIVFLPRKRSSLPSMIVELKWNKGADGAIKQIKENNYPYLPVRLTGEVLLVGINYNQHTKHHTCLIEKIKA